MNNDLFHLRVVGREGLIYEEDVSSITSYNEAGKFDVLSQHANFISLIRKEVVIIDKQGRKKEFPFNNALIKVTENDVKIYLGIEGIIDAPSSYSTSS